MKKAQLFFRKNDRMQFEINGFCAGVNILREEDDAADVARVTIKTTPVNDTHQDFSLEVGYRGERGAIVHDIIITGWELTNETK